MVANIIWHVLAIIVLAGAYGIVYIMWKNDPLNKK